MSDEKKTEELKDVDGGMAGPAITSEDPLEGADGGSEQTKEQLGMLGDPLEDVDGGMPRDSVLD